MSADQINADLKLVVSLMTLAVSLGQAVEQFLPMLVQLIFGKPLTAAQRAELAKSNSDMSAALQAPLAPEPGA